MADSATNVQGKLDQRFKLLDTDQDGFIEKSDYVGLVKRHIQAAGRSEQDDVQLTQGALKGVDDLWDALSAKADLNKDEKITRDEYTRALSQVANDDGLFDMLWGALVTEIVMLYDQDESGDLDHAELRTFLATNGLTHTEADASARKLDPSGAGVSVEKIIELIHEYYTSGDPNAPGNALFKAPKS